MRVLAIGDVHGCFRALTSLVEAAQVTPDDLLVTLGDYVDRGNFSIEVLILKVLPESSKRKLSN